MKLRKMPYWQDGQRKLSDKLYAVFVDWSEALRRMPLFKDRKASEEMARKIDRLNSIRASGDTMPPELVRYVETMPPAIRGKLAEWGILSAARVAAGKALIGHVADWKAAVLAKGNTLRHAELASGRAAKAFAGCGFKLWSDIRASKLQSHLADQRADRRKADGSAVRGMSAQTFNFYLQAVKQFCRWMVRDGRATESPLAHLQGLNVKTDRRHDRRALSPDEMRWLLETAAHAPTRFGMSGGERAMLYRLAVETGLRAAELRSLTRSSFNLGDEPSVTIAAAYAKNRRQDILPLRAATTALLTTHLAGKMPQAQAFAVPRDSMGAKMFRADLADARRAWLESHGTQPERTEAAKGTFLSARDESGRWADFHALRHTFITGLVSGGVNPKVAQTLARHSVITLTMDRYTHLYAGNLAAALDVLPDLSAPARKVTVATGTDNTILPDCVALPNRLSPGLSPDGAVSNSLMQSGAVNRVNVLNAGIAKKPEKAAVLDSAGGFSRKPPKGLEPLTCDLQNRCSAN